MRRLLVLLCAVLLLPTLAVAAERQPVVGGALTIPVPYLPVSLSVFHSYSPYEDAIMRQILGPGLLRYSPEFKVEPGLIRQLPRVSDDGLTYSFWLRSGVKWHDGREMTAEDVAWTLGVYMDPMYYGPKKGMVSAIAQVEATDRYVLKVTLKEPDLGLLDAGIFFEPPLPKHLYKPLVESNGWWSGEQYKLIGAGPFMFGELSEDQYVRLDRNPEYWEAKVNPAVGPWIKHLYFRNMDERTALAAFGRGEVSMIPEVPQELMHWYAAESEQYQPYWWDRFGYGWLHLQTERFPTNIKQVRQALAYSLDRKSVIDLRWDGFGKEPAGIFVPDHPYATPNISGYGHDPERAHTLLREAGFDRGHDGIYRMGDRDLEITIVATDMTQLIIEPVAKSWRRLGARVHVQYVEFHRLVGDYMPEGQFHAVFSGLNNLLDPGATLRPFHSREILLDEQGLVRGSNRTRYQSARVDALLDQAAKATSSTARRSLYRQAEALILEDAPVIAIYQNSYLGLVSTEFQGVVVIPTQEFGFYERWYQGN